MKNNIKKQKGFLSLELSIVLGIVSVVTVFTLYWIFSYFENEKTFIAAENVTIIKNFSQKTNFDFENLNAENIEYLPKNVLYAKNNKIYLSPLGKEVETGVFTNTMIPLKAGDKVGVYFAIKNLKDRECNIIGGVLAPKYYESFVVEDGTNLSTVDSNSHMANLIKLTPIADKEGVGRNKVGVSRLIKQCEGGNKTLILKDVSEIDTQMYKLTKRNTISSTKFNEMVDYAKKSNPVGNIEITYFYNFWKDLIDQDNKNKGLVEFYVELMNHRENIQKNLN